MSITKQVRDFFSGRIYAVLNAKIAKAEEAIDRSILAEAIQREALEIAGDPTLAKEYDEWKELDKRADEMRDSLRKRTNKAAEKLGIRTASYYSMDLPVMFAEYQTMHEKAFKQLMWPDVVAEVSKIEKIKDDVEAVVMLATTERKLVEKLAKVLTAYGADEGMQELIALIPNDD